MQSLISSYESEEYDFVLDLQLIAKITSFELSDAKDLLKSLSVDDTGK